MKGIPRPLAVVLVLAGVVNLVAFIAALAGLAGLL